MDTFFGLTDDLDVEEDLIQTQPIIAPADPAQYRNGPVSPPYAVFDNLKFKHGVSLDRGSTWKLNANYRDNAPYLFIRQIIKDLSTDEVIVRGLPMFPDKHLKGMLDWGGYAKYNTYLFVKVDRDDRRPWYVQGMVEIPLDGLDWQIPCNLSPNHYDRNAGAEVAVHLTCRRVLIESFSNANERLQKPPKKLDIEYILHTLSVCCIGEVRRTVDDRCQPTVPRYALNQVAYSSRQCSYHNCTYISTFSGCGGDSRGAKDAGALVRIGIDNHEPATRTMQMNFPNTLVLCNDVANLAQYRQLKCRICHLSPPCQPHSFAHTCAGRNDDRNYIASLNCKAIIEAVDPDIITLENVAGLMSKATSVQWFVTIINQLAESGRGYNVRWKLVKFREYGLVPRRTRFVAFASK